MDGVRLIEADMDGTRIYRKAAAECLEERFLQGPDLEKIGGPILGRESAKVGQFVAGEDIGGYVVAWKIGIDQFDVDAERVMAGDRNGGEIAGVGDIELPISHAGEGRLSLRLVAEENFFRRRADVPAQEEAQASPAGNEAGLVFFKGKPSGAFALLGERMVRRLPIAAFVEAREVFQTWTSPARRA